MNKIKSPYIVFVLMVLLSSCAETKITPNSETHHTENKALPIVEIDSFLDLENTSKKYSRPVIWVRIASIKDRLILENNIIENFRNKNIKPIPGVEVFPPGEEISREFIVPAFQKSGGDSLFIVSLKPNSTLHHMAYEATLYDDKLHKTWIGHVVTNSQQTRFTHKQTDELLFRSTARKIVDQILKDGVIIKSDN